MSTCKCRDVSFLTSYFPVAAVSFTSSVLHPLFQISHETDGATIFPRGAVPEAQSADAGVAALFGAAAPWAYGVVPWAPFADEILDAPVSAADIFAALVSRADAAEPRVSADNAPAFDVLIPAAVSPGGVDSAQRPRFFDVPNIDWFSSFSSYCEVAGKEYVHSPSGARANAGPYSILATPDLRHSKRWEHENNTPNPGHNNASDTNVPPTDATTSHPRKIYLRPYQEQRIRRMHRAPRPPQEVPKKRQGAAEEIRYLYLLLPLWVREKRLLLPRGLTQEITFSYCCLLQLSYAPFVSFNGNTL